MTEKNNFTPGQRVIVDFGDASAFIGTVVVDRSARDGAIPIYSDEGWICFIRPQRMQILGGGRCAPRDIPQQTQRQDSLTNQLIDLRIAAVRLGLYDADDWIQRWWDECHLPTIAKTLAQND